jgi:hypothetical protein
MQVTKVEVAEMFEQKLYELRVEGRGTCEFRATRPYSVGDSLPLPLAYDEGTASDHAFLWAIVAVRPAERARLDAVLLLEPAIAAPCAA